MKKVTVSISDRHEYELQARQRLDDLGSRSAAIRTAIEEYGEWKAQYSELEDEYAELQARCEKREERINELESQLAKRSNIEQEIRDLPDKIRDYGTYSERRQRLLDRATLAQRIKWKVTGVPVDKLDEETDT